MQYGMILSFQAPCCGKDYICRVCHDDKENHELNRREVQKIKCLICGTAQAVSKVLSEFE